MIVFQLQFFHFHQCGIRAFSLIKGKSPVQSSAGGIIDQQKAVIQTKNVLPFFRSIFFSAMPARLAEAAEVDALDEQAIDKHLQSVVATARRIDISFNAIGNRPMKYLGAPLVDMDLNQFSMPIMSYITSYFLTARLAARCMLPNRSGVVMTVTAPPARIGTPNGGYGPAQAAKEALTRYLSLELAPQGIRVVGLQPHAMPETETIKEIFESRAGTHGVTWEQFSGYIAGMNHPKRFLTLAEVANVAAFVASDKASAMMGTTVNLTMGALDD
jgi:NAD(P)-dependent dehydrogenase (short-subunit alcohol dehydrogenase family)